MRLWTWAEIKQKVENDLDLQGEEICSASELMAYGNEAIDEAEAVIHNLAEDYFFTKQMISMVAGESLLSLPSDIYAQKVRSLQYDDGTARYTIVRIKHLDLISGMLPTDNYRYLPSNKMNTGLNTDHGQKCELFPPARASGSFITCYYLRNARRMGADADECDIPEFVSFIINFIKSKVCIKELHPRMEYFMSELERTREQMALTLTEMTPDGDNDIEPDMSSYLEHA